MRNRFSLVFLTLLAARTLWAADENAAALRSAAQALAAKPNYSWKASFQTEPGNGTSRAGISEGKTEREGYTFLTSSFGDNQIAIALKGSNSVVNRQGTWETLAEVADDADWIARRLRVYQTPAQEALAILRQTRSLQHSPDGAFSGELTDIGVHELLTRGRRADLSISNAKGTAKFWVTDGLLTKYQYSVEGSITGDEQQKSTTPVRRVITIEILEVGTTRVVIPDLALKKLL